MIPTLRPVVARAMWRPNSSLSCQGWMLFSSGLKPSRGGRVRSTRAVTSIPPHLALAGRSFAASSGASSASSPSSMEALKELRSRSGAPIVDCKKALGASNNDVGAALDWLREHGAARASSKVQGRATNEGLVAVSLAHDGHGGSLVHVSSETDFAGRSDKFVELVTGVAQIALEHRASFAGKDEVGSLLPPETLLGLSDPETGKSVQDLLDDAVVAIRENMKVEYAAALQCNDNANGGGEGEMVVGYVHNRVGLGVGDGVGTAMAGTAAALVHVTSVDPTVTAEKLRIVGRKLAMHVVAARPQYLSSTDVPADVVKHEREILLKQEESSGKAPEVLDKVVQGRLRKFYEGVCLLDQPHFIEERNPKVGPFLKEQGIAVKRFETRFIGS